jgi:deoxyadenosine/deoxycytidine kinase
LLIHYNTNKIIRTIAYISHYGKNNARSILLFIQENACKENEIKWYLLNKGQIMINSSVGRLSISIEGNIGAGKSTFLSIVDQWLDAQVVYEPHKKWQEVGGENLLEKFYNDTTRWAYTFQTFAFVSRVVQQETIGRKSDHIFQVLERSVFSDRYCFAKNCFQMGTMTALEWKLYQEWFSWLVNTYARPLSGFIYLQTDPKVCYKRLQKRNRMEEADVSQEYLNMIHDKHECNNDFEADMSEQEKHIYKIHDFFGIPLKQNNHKMNNFHSVSL